MRKTLFAVVSALAMACLCGKAAAQETKPKYYFTISNVTADDPKVIPLAKDLLAAEVAKRPEFTSDLGGAEGQAAVVELKKRGLEGYEVNMRITTLSREVKDPAPGRRDPQLAINVQLGVFGTTYPGNKVRFTGDGAATLVGEFSERRRARDEEMLLKTALTSAIQQAISNASLKLSTDSRPLGAPKAKRKKAKKH
jgi:hypothetical protein